MSELPQAIFFDLDDTIIDDSSNVHEVWRAAVESEARVLAGLDIEEILAHVQAIRAWYWADEARHRVGRADLRGTSAWIAGQALQRLGVDDAAVARRIGYLYRDIRDRGHVLLPGAIEALERVRGLGLRTALLTNGTAEGQRAKLVQFDLARHFDYVCIEGEFGCGKPDERVYREALRALGCDPASTWMVGDNLEWDVAAPMRLGIAGIWLDRFQTGLPDPAPVQPHRIVLSISELLAD